MPIESMGELLSSHFIAFASRVNGLISRTSAAMKDS
jgi:hypothetical protein